MPFYTKGQEPSPSKPDSRPETSFYDPSATDVVGAAFRQENSFWSAYTENRDVPSRLRVMNRDVDQNFDPFQGIEGYEDHAMRFAAANNENEVAAIKRQIDKELQDKETLDDAGALGVVAQVGAGILDPINLVPVGGAAVRGYRVGGAVLGTAVRTAKAGFLGASVAEIALHASQQTRTMTDSAINIGTATFLSGVLGGSLDFAKRAIESRAANRLYSAAINYPAGGKKSDRVEIVLGDLEQGLNRVFLDRGLGEVGPDGSVKVKVNSGLVKIIWKHGEKSQESGVFQVNRSDIVAMPNIFRKFKGTYHPDPKTGQDRWLWVVERGGAEKARVLYVVKRMEKADGLDYVVTVHTLKRGQVGRPEYAKSVSRRAWAKSQKSAQKESAQPGSESPEVDGGTTGIPQDGLPIPGANPTKGITQGTVEGQSAGNARKGNIGADQKNSKPDPFEDQAGRWDDLEKRTERALDPAKAAAEEGIEGELPEVDNPVRGEGGSVGAAASRANTLESESLKSAGGLEKALKFQDPLLRTLNSTSVAARRFMQELAEVPLIFSKNAEGVATPVAVETRVKMWQAPLYEAMKLTDDAFVRYRLGRAKKTGDVARLAAKDLFGAPEGQMTFPEFKIEVGRAMRRGDDHAIPEVAEAARTWREKVFDPLKNEAIDLELLPEDIGVDTAPSYLSRLYDHEKISARRGEFVSIVSRWLKQRQEVRRAIQEEIRPLLEAEAALRQRTKASEGSAASNQRQQAKVETRLEEARSQLQKLVGRAFDLDEQAKAAKASGQDWRADRAETKAAELSSRINALRERVNSLHDQASGKSAKGDALQTYLDDLRQRYDATVDDINHVLMEWPGRKVDGIKDAKKALKSDTDMDDLELLDLADEITDRILGTPAGRLPYDAHKEGGGGFQNQKVKGPLKARVFAIPDALIEDYLESDIEIVGRSYIRSMAPDVEITRQFGSVDMVDQLGDIRREYAQRIAETESEAERQKFDKQKDAAIRDIDAVRKRIRNEFGLPSDPNSVFVRTGRVLRNLNYLRLLGGMTLSAIPDIGRPVMVHGFGRVFGRGFLPMVRNLKAYNLATEEVRLAGAALDMVLDSRTMAIADIMDDYGRHSKFERGVQSLTSSFGVVSLMAPWNAAMKNFAGIVTMSRILESSRAVADGTIGKGDLERLAASGISQGMAIRIARQFDQVGETADGGVLLANTASWADREAVQTFRAALLKEVDRIIVTPGQDKPLWMSTEAGKMIGQFRSFAIASSQRVLIAGVQQRDMAALNGAGMMIGLGALSYYLKSVTAGVEPSEDWEKYVIEGVDRSGLTGWLFEANNMAEKFTRGQVGISAMSGQGTMSRYASRNVMGALLGPTTGLVTDLAQTTGSVSTGDWRESDTRALRRMVPFQNIFYLRKLFDQAEAGINDAIGAE